MRSLLLAAVLLALGTGPAAASTVSLTEMTDSSSPKSGPFDVGVWRAAPGERNVVTAERRGDTWVLRDAAGPIAAAAGCVANPDGTAACPSALGWSFGAGDGDDELLLDVPADQVFLHVGGAMGDGRDTIRASGDGKVVSVVGGALSGGPGDDRLEVVGTSFITFAGDEGADAISGGPSSDSLSGGPGDDLVEGGDGIDRVSGGDGADRIATGAGDDEIDGGDGGPADGDDRIDAGAGDDVIYGGLGADVLLGGDGADFLGGGAGADELRAGDGDDVIAAAPTQDGRPDAAAFDRDVVDGGAGRDRVGYSSARGGVTVDLAAGVGGGAGERDALSGVEDATGGWGVDRLVGDDGPNVLDGGPTTPDRRLRPARPQAGSGDVLLAAGGDDVLRGGDALGLPGILVGGAGSDRLEPTGASTADGGDGDDVLVGTTEPVPSAAALRCGAGADRVERPQVGDEISLACESIVAPPYRFERPARDRRVVTAAVGPADDATGRACRSLVTLTGAGERRLPLARARVTVPAAGTRTLRLTGTRPLLARVRIGVRALRCRDAGSGRWTRPPADRRAVRWIVLDLDARR